MTPLTIAILFISTSLTAVISAVSGMGGGVVLLSIMTLFLPLEVIVPIHGVVQLFSNSIRTWYLKDNVVRKVLMWFAIGLPFGTFIAINIVKSVQNKDIFLILIAAMIFYSVLKPKKLPELKIPFWGFSIIGILVGILGPLIGAFGPMTAPFFIRDDFTKEQVIATKSSIQLLGHLAKIPTFIILGFNFKEYALPIIVMILGAFIGTSFGVKVLKNLKESHFKIIFKTALLLAGTRILYKVIF